MSRLLPSHLQRHQRAKGSPPLTSRPRKTECPRRDIRVAACVNAIAKRSDQRTAFRALVFGMDRNTSRAPAPPIRRSHFAVWHPAAVHVVLPCPSAGHERSTQSTTSPSLAARDRHLSRPPPSPNRRRPLRRRPAARPSAFAIPAPSSAAAGPAAESLVPRLQILIQNILRFLSIGVQERPSMQPHSCMSLGGGFSPPCQLTTSASLSGHHASDP